MYFKLLIYVSVAFSIAAASIVFGKSDHMSILVGELFVNQLAQVAPELDFDIEKLDWTIVKTQIKGAEISYKDIISMRASGTVYPSIMSLLGSPAFKADLDIDNPNGLAVPLSVDYSKSEKGVNLFFKLPEYPLVSNPLFSNDFGISSGTMSTIVNVEGKSGNIEIGISEMTFLRQAISPKAKSMIENVVRKWFLLDSVPEYLTNGSILGNIGSVSLSGIIDYNGDTYEIKGVNLLTRVMRVVGGFTVRDGGIDGQLKLVVKNGKVSEVKFILEQLFNASVDESNLYGISFNGENGIKVEALKK